MAANQRASATMRRLASRRVGTEVDIITSSLQQTLSVDNGTECHYYPCMRKLLASCALVLLFAPGVLAQTAPTPVKATPENAAAFLGDWTLNGEGPNGPVAMTLSLTPEG